MTLVGSVAITTMVSGPAQAKPNTVTVSAVGELADAVEGGAKTVLVEPGVYEFDETLVLQDIKLIGVGDGVEFRSADPLQATSNQAPLLTVAGKVTVEGIDFRGGGFVYIASSLAADAQPKNKVVVTGCTFVTELPDFEAGPPFDMALFVNATLFGNVLAGPESAVDWDVRFENNYSFGGFAGLILGHFASIGGELSAQVANNVFERSLDPALIVIGTQSGTQGAVTGTSVNNTYIDTSLSVGGGIGDFFFGLNNPGIPGPGGSFGDVDWTSRNETFTGGTAGIAGYGGRRYRLIDVPSASNHVDLTIDSPTFDVTTLGFIEILGSSINFPDPVGGDFGANGSEAGNTIIADLRNVDFTGQPGGVYIANHASNLTDRFVPAPPEPSYGNVARILGKKKNFLKQNPGLDYIPDWFFTK